MLKPINLENKCRNVLFISNTYYQLMVAVQLRLTLYKNCCADLWLSDLSESSLEIASNLRDTELFNSVEYTAAKDWINEQGNMGIGGKVRSLLSPGFDIRNSRTASPYDLIIFFNITDEVYWISNAARSLGGRGELARMEEGLVSCDSSHSHYALGRNAVREKVRRVLRRPCISNPQTPFYCFFPKLCDVDFPLRPLLIPSISQTKHEIVAALKMIFQHVDFPYQQRYIYFASSSDVDDNSFGETKMVLDIANIVGKNNLAVKMHPRDGRDVYEKEGLTVVENSYVPWEVFQLCNDFSDKVFLSATSGSFLAMSAMLDSGQPPSFFVSPGTMTEAQKESWRASRCWVDSTVEKLHNMGLCRNVRSISLLELSRLVDTQLLGKPCQK